MPTFKALPLSLYFLGLIRCDRKNSIINITHTTRWPITGQTAKPKVGASCCPAFIGYFSDINTIGPKSVPGANEGANERHDSPGQKARLRANKSHRSLARHEASGVISSWADVSCQQAIRSLGTHRGWMGWGWGKEDASGLCGGGLPTESRANRREMDRQTDCHTRLFGCRASIWRQWVQRVE